MNNVTALSIARLAIYAREFRPGSPDSKYNIGHTVSGVEVNLAIVTASPTALNSLVHFAPGIWGSGAQHVGASTTGRRSTTASGERRAAGSSSGHVSVKEWIPATKAGE